MKMKIHQQKEQRRKRNGEKTFEKAHSISLLSLYVRQTISVSALVIRFGGSVVFSLFESWIDSLS